MVKHLATGVAFVDDDAPASAGEDVVHVIPLYDAIDHDETTSCICCPAVEQDTSDGSIVIVHYACDGREQRAASRKVMN